MTPFRMTGDNARLLSYYELDKALGLTEIAIFRGKFLLPALILVPSIGRG